MKTTNTKNKSFKKVLGLSFATLILGTQIIAPLSVQVEAATNPSAATSIGTEKISYRGLEDKTIKVNDTFNPLNGVTAISSEGIDLTSKIEVLDKVDTTKAGDYKVMYFLKDASGKQVSGTKKIKVVVDRDPVILGAENLTIKAGTKFMAFSGLTAFDEEDGEISKNIQGFDTVNSNEIGNYSITYYVIDSAGNVGTKERTITVVSKDAPTIKGADYKEVQLDSKFNPLDGISASDKDSNDLTNSIKVTGTVNTKKAGTYELTYSVTDVKNNKVTIKRTIKVSSNKKTVISGAKDIQIFVTDKFDPLKGIKATNIDDGDITHLLKYTSNVVEGKIGSYEVKYSIVDSGGNATAVTRHIEIVAGNVPVISGAEDITIPLNGTFDVFSGITAQDVEDGDLTSIIQGFNTVDTKVAGTYEITYFVIDSAGNVGSKERVITVK